MHATRPRFPTVAAAGALLASSLIVPPVEAGVQSPAQTACIVKLNKAGTSAAKAQARETAGCMKSRSKGGISAAEVQTCLTADAKGKFAKSRTKAETAETDECGEVPEFGFTSAAAVVDAALEHELGLAEDAFGLDLGDAIVLADDGAAAAKCQARVLKAAEKVVATELKAFSKCKGSGLKDGFITDTASLAACLDTVAADAKGKVDKAHGAVAKAVDQKCLGVDLEESFPGACADALDTADCIATKADCRACLMISAADDLDADCDTFDDGVANSSCILCNGAASLCDRSFEDVVYPTSHNAMSNAEEGWLAPNNTFSVPNQLAAGIRAVMLDTWYHDSDAVLCHGGQLTPTIGCDVTGMKPLDVGLAELDAYLDANPNEILSIIFESYITEADTEADFIASGLIDHVHVQSLASPWPTLRDLITAGTRLVVFTDDSGVSLPWHHYVWDHAWETHFSNQEPEDFSCAPNRGSTSNDLFILNHFLTNPVATPALASMVNYNPFFIDRAVQCQTESADLPNFVTVDFEDIGDLYDVVRELNGLP